VTECGVEVSNIPCPPPKTSFLFYFHLHDASFFDSNEATVAESAYEINSFQLTNISMD
jgi:hypothetical protein